MTDFRTFEEFFANLKSASKIKHFAADEFTNYFHVHRRGVKNSEPPREMWGNITVPLKVVDDLREFYNRPIVLLSSYRSPAYNRAISGAATKSFHMQFKALDIAVAGVAPHVVFRELKKWRSAGRFSGGLGLYRSFVHIDGRGYDATWGE